MLGKVPGGKNHDPGRNYPLDSVFNPPPVVTMGEVAMMLMLMIRRERERARQQLPRSGEVTELTEATEAAVVTVKSEGASRGGQSVPPGSE